MIGIVIPARNEAHHIAACVASAILAGKHPMLCGEGVEVLVVADRCTDGTERIAIANGALTLSIQAKNVGHARAAGADSLLQRNARWLAFTDADSTVAPDWLASQMDLGADVVCGTVEVSDWSAHLENAPRLRDHFARTYNDMDGHRHIHGANLGVCASAYLKVGGFQHLHCSEDVALVEALNASGASIAWSASPRVTTSARTDARARGGFGDTLLAVTSSFIG